MQTKIALKPSQTIVFIGDSITDMGRNQPAYSSGRRSPVRCGISRLCEMLRRSRSAGAPSRSPDRPLGFGYVHFVGNLLLAKYPQLNLNIINTGISGNTVRDLKNRWEKDCLKHKPDILSVLIGINDLYRRYSEPEELPEAVYPDEYESTYRQLLSLVKQKSNSQLVLIEPFMFCDDSENNIFQELRAYIRIVHKLAEEFDAVLVPLQGWISEQIKQIQPEKWSEDSVHPYTWAHAWLAWRWLEATGL